MEEALRTIRRYSGSSVSVKDLMNRQQDFHERDVCAIGKVLSVISQDIVDERLVRGLIFFDNIPISSSVTLFVMEDSHGSKILVNYPSDLDVSSGDEVTVVGVFHGHNLELRGILRKKTITSRYGEPYVSARIVQNKTRNKIDLIAKSTAYGPRLFPF